MLTFEVASVFVRVERRGEELDLSGPLPLAAVPAYIDVITAFVHAEQAACGRAALAVSRGDLYRERTLERDRAGTACSSAASLLASVDGSLRTRMSTLRTDISTLGKVIL